MALSLSNTKFKYVLIFLCTIVVSLVVLQGEFLTSEPSTLYTEIQELKEQIRDIKQNEQYLIQLLQANSETNLNTKQRNDKHISPKEQYLLNWLDSYTKFHNTAREAFKTQNNTIMDLDSIKYARCHGYNGFGNCIQSIIPCFLYALVSNRVVIISPDVVFPFKNYFKEGPIDYYFPFPVSNYGENDILKIDVNTLACIHFDDLKHKAVDMAGSWGYDFFGQTLLVNPHYNLTYALPDNWFQILFDYLFQLSPELQTQVDTFKTDHFGDYNIAIQIRAPITKTAPADWYKGKKDHEGHPVPPLTLFSQAAEILSSQQDIPYDRIKWLVATQDTGYVEGLRDLYGEDKIAFLEGKIVTTFDPDAAGQTISFLTWYLMSECDDIITTESSSYGVSAAARGGMKPVVCNHARFCARKLTATPCQQTPFYVDKNDPYKVKPRDCLADTKQPWNSVESSCAYFEAVIREDPKYEKGEAW